MRRKTLKEEAIEWLKAFLYAVVAATIIRLFVFETMLVPTGSMIPTININDRLFIEKITYTVRKPETGDIVVFWSPFVDERAQQMLRLFDKFMDLFAPARFKGHVKYVKRVVGKPGDVIQIKIDDTGKYRVYVNGTIPESLKDIAYLPDGVFRYPDLWNWLIEASKLRQNQSAYREYLQQLAKQDPLAANLVFSIVGGMYPVPLGIVFDDDVYESLNPRDFIKQTDEGISIIVPEGFYFMMGDNSPESFDSRYFGFVPVDHIIGKPILRIWPFKNFGPIQKGS
nr:signal peptidase I [Pseudothermotoga thermarum]